jgi:hypothetical protein
LIDSWVNSRWTRNDRAAELLGEQEPQVSLRVSESFHNF